MQGGLCKKGSFPFLLPFDSRTEEGRGPRAAALRRPSGHGRGRRDGEKREGDEGVLSLSSPWAEVVGEAAPREGAAAGVSRRRCSGAAALESSGEIVRWLWRCEMRRGAARGYLLPE
jgi:hypothetical protein